MAPNNRETLANATHAPAGTRDTADRRPLPGLSPQYASSSNTSGNTTAIALARHDSTNRIDIATSQRRPRRSRYRNAAMHAPRKNTT